MKINFSHRLEKDDARERLKALGEYLQNHHGIGVNWNDPDHARVSGRYLVVAIDGTVTLEDTGLVVFEAKDPGFLWRNKAKEYLIEKLKKYLDPQTPIDQLPRR